MARRTSTSTKTVEPEVTETEPTTESEYVPETDPSDPFSPENDLTEDDLTETDEDDDEFEYETTEGMADEAEAEASDEAAIKANTKAEIPEADLSEFKALAETAVENADEATGEIALTYLEPVVLEYQKIEGQKNKNLAKTWLNDQMKVGMNELKSIKVARAYLDLHTAMKAGPATKTEKVPTDPNEASAQRVAVLKLASSYVYLGGEGVDKDKVFEISNKLVEDSKADVEKYVAWMIEGEDEASEPKGVSILVKNAAKLAIGKSARAGARTTSTGTPFTGDRRDIGQHIIEAFAAREEGQFLSIAEIRKFESTEYGTSSPSAGAISARLFPKGGGKCTVPGVQPATSDDGKGLKGAVKASA